MPRSRSPNRDIAKDMYLKAKGDIKLKDIANELGIKDTQVRKWKSEENWDKELKGTLSKKEKEQRKKNVTKKIKEPKEPDYSKNNYLEVDELTERQRTFCEIFIQYPIAYKAAIKAGYSPSSAYSEASRLLKNVKVKSYIDYLRQIKKEILLFNIDDIVEKQMKIAFADITDYMEFGREWIPVMSKNGPIIYNNPTTGQQEILKQSINSARLKESWEVDGSLIKEVNVSRQGTSIKLHDSQKAMDWLRDFFNYNPEHRYKKEFDSKKLQLERERFEHVKEMDKNNNW